MSFGFRAVANPLAGLRPPVGTTRGPDSADPEEVRAFHRRLPGYAPTPLVSLPRLASSLEIGELLVKVESTRFGLPAFKMLGASWATYRALRERVGEGVPTAGVPTAATGAAVVATDGTTAGTATATTATATATAQGADLDSWTDVEELARALEPLLPFRLAAATDGNHGRAVARMASWLGFEARIYVPRGTTDARIGAIAGEGAEVVVVDGGYDDAVARSAEEAGPRCLVISDTSWPGYADVPRWVIEGYGTMFAEVDDALAGKAKEGPGVVVVPIGVGALAAATVAYADTLPRRPGVIGVEPTSAACATASALAGDLVTLTGPQDSIMAGLNCGTPSPVAWPQVSNGVAGFVTIDDDWARGAVRELACAGIEAGETGAAALGGLMALRRQGNATELAGLVDASTSVLVLATEGASDLPAWRGILGTELVG